MVLLKQAVYLAFLAAIILLIALRSNMRLLKHWKPIAFPGCGD
jgi:hypothetical protein